MTDPQHPFPFVQADAEPLDPELQRASRIAAIHAFADWLAMRPQAPVPTVIWAEHIIDQDDEVDEQTRVRGALDLMHRVQATPYEGRHAVVGDVDICTRQMHGIRIVYRVAAMKDRVPDRVYVTRDGS
jgi:hypothetical protein